MQNNMRKFIALWIFIEILRFSDMQEGTGEGAKYYLSEDADKAGKNEEENG